MYTYEPPMPRPSTLTPGAATSTLTGPADRTSCLSISLLSQGNPQLHRQGHCGRFKVAKAISHCHGFSSLHKEAMVIKTRRRVH